MANVIEVESDGEEGDMRDIATTVAGATVAAPAVGYLPLYPGHVPLWPPLMPGAAASLDQARGSAIPRPVPRPHLSADANAFAAGHQRVPPPPDGSFDFARMDTNGQSAGVGGLEVVVEEDFHDVTETPLVVRPMAGRLEPIGVYIVPRTGRLTTRERTILENTTVRWPEQTRHLVYASTTAT